MSIALRAFCVSDVHSDLAAARRLGGAALALAADVFISAGDLGVDGAADPAVYGALTPEGVPVLSVPGNHDGDDAYDALAAQHGWTDLDGRVVQRNGTWFAGIGLRAWDGSSDALDDPAARALLSRLEGIPPQRLVLATHVPPHGTAAALDRAGVDRGSPLLAEWVASWQPAACVCGHVHHREVVVEHAGRTLVVNAGRHGYLLRL